MADVKSTSDVVELETRVKASPETLWRFLTEPEKLTRWMGRRAQMDPRPGGAHRVEISDQAVGAGEVVEAVPGSRLVLTWGWEGHPAVGPGSTTVEITLEPDGEETVVRLRHLGLPADEREMHADGWGHYLDRLAVAGSGGDPGPDRNEGRG